uniref:ARAD1B22528p n=1 Tax=Blastobotrys adeninivorans TaxID=409370 RepID=A0A060T7C2_BLAAD
MAVKNYVFAPRYSTGFVVGGISPSSVLRWAPTLGLWGGAAGITLFFLVDSIPIFRRGLYEKLPLVGSRYDDSVDPQDSPF